ncbi:MAG: hypothetical protein ACK50E_01530, partial [Bacteroidota bacterium]
DPNTSEQDYADFLSNELSGNVSPDDFLQLPTKGDMYEFYVNYVNQMTKPVKKLKNDLISFNQTDFQNLEKLAKSRSMNNEEFADYLSQLLNRKYSVRDFQLKGSKQQMYNFFMGVKDNVLEQIRLNQTQLQENENKQKRADAREKKRIEDDAERQRLEKRNNLNRLITLLRDVKTRVGQIPNDNTEDNRNALKALIDEIRSEFRLGPAKTAKTVANLKLALNSYIDTTSRNLRSQLQNI